MKPERAQKILEETKSNFDKIAEHFSKTRQWPWEVMKSFLVYIKEKDKVLDIGCGNGRLFDLMKDKNIFYVGIDNSEKLIEIARKNFQFPISNFQTNLKSQITNYQSPIFQVADALELPFGNEEFDHIFMLAVLPHIPSQELQIKVLKNAYRVLKKDGYLFITCWNRWQFRHWKYLWQDLKYKSKNKEVSRDLGWRDFYVPWHLFSKETIMRFYHLFTKNELKKILEKSGFKGLEIYYEYKGKKSNWLKGFNLVGVAKK